MDFESDELLQEFLEESFDIIESINSILAQVLGKKDIGDDLDALFRGIHTIKGGSGMFALKNLHNISHELETYLSQIKEQNQKSASYSLSSDIIHYMQDRVDTIERLLKDGDDSISQEEVSKNIEPSAKNDAKPTDGVSVYFKSFYSDFSDLISDFNERKIPQFEIRVSQHKKDKLINLLEKVGFTPLNQDKFEGDAIILFIYEQDNFEDMLPVIQKIKNVCEFRWIYSPISEEVHAPEEASSDMGQEQETQSRQVTPSSRPVEMLRIPLDRVNDVLDNIWEVFLIRNQLAYLMDQHRDELRNHVSFVQAFDSLDTILKRNISEIESKTMSMRMSSVRNIFQRMQKVVQKYTHSTDKEIIFETSGEHIELDKKVIDMLSEPLIHLVRNAMDHGIETPQERAKAGKDKKGRIKLAATMAGNTATIEIKDDGKGINPQRVLESAKEKNLDVSHVKSDNDAVHLIFMPGFSTAERISDVSGRGVGMDAVRNSVESLGGSVRVQTKMGEGSTFKIELPLGMSVISALIVKINDVLYALNSELVLMTKKISIFDLKNNGEQEYFLFNDRYIPSFPLPDFFIKPTASNYQGVETSASICVIETTNGPMALRVDDIIQSTGLVAKPVSNLGPQHPFVAGMALLQSGDPVMILDAAGVASSAAPCDIDDRRQDLNDDRKSA